MKELIVLIVKALVDQPNDVDVREVEGPEGLVVELRVAPGDVGKVIGRQGRTVKAMRTLLHASSIKSGKKVMLEVVE